MTVYLYIYMYVCVYMSVCVHIQFSATGGKRTSPRISCLQNTWCVLCSARVAEYEKCNSWQRRKEREGEGFHGLREPIRFWTLFLLLGKGSPKVEPQKGLRSWPQGAEAKGWARGCEGRGRSTWGLSCPCHTLDTRRELSLIGRNWSLQLPVSFQLAGLLGRWGPAYTHLSRLCVAEGGGLDRAGQHDHFIYYYFF